MSTEPRSVAVTGASTGIGRATALHLAERGWRVFGSVRKDTDAERLHDASAGRVQPVRMDVTDTASIDAAVRTVEETVGEAGLQGLVNNAGVSVPGAIEFLELDEMRRQLEVNLVGQVAVTQAFLPAIRAGAGRVVNVGSMSGFVSSPFLGRLQRVQVRARGHHRRPPSRAPAVAHPGLDRAARQHRHRDLVQGRSLCPEGDREPRRPQQGALRGRHGRHGQGARSARQDRRSGREGGARRRPGAHRPAAADPLPGRVGTPGSCAA